VRRASTTPIPNSAGAIDCVSTVASVTSTAAIGPERAMVSASRMPSSASTATRPSRRPRSAPVSLFSRGQRRSPRQIEPDSRAIVPAS
jgi:hypothetical protein